MFCKMRFPVFLFLVGMPSLLQGLEKGLGDLPKMETNFLKPVLATYTVYKGCGGVIPLSPVFNSVIQYKFGELYDSWEYCVWTLLPADEVTNVLVATYQDIPHSFAGITAYFLNSTGIITSKKLPGNNTEFHFNTPLAFLVFSSGAAPQANGFYISLFSTGDSATTSTAAYHVRKDEGEFSYPIKDPLRNRDKAMALVLQRKTTGYVETHLEVNLENVTIDQKDAIQVYSFNEYRMPDALSLVKIGRFTTDATFQVPSIHPLLILLESEDNILRGKGFRVEWKEYTHSIE